jgi:hypothetical protein
MSNSFSVNSGKALITEMQKRWLQCEQNCDSFQPSFVNEEMWRPQPKAFAYPVRKFFFIVVAGRVGKVPPSLPPGFSCETQLERSPEPPDPPRAQGSKWFTRFSTAMILINSIVLFAEHYPIFNEWFTPVCRGMWARVLWADLDAWHSKPVT